MDREERPPDHDRVGAVGDEVEHLDGVAEHCGENAQCRPHRRLAQARIQGRISVPAKKNAISVAAFSTLSEPCTELASMLSANCARTVCGSAFLGSVAPMMSRFLSTAPSPSSTCTTTGAVIIDDTRLAKNGRALWTS